MYKPDTYTKAVLTVIALALITLCFQNALTPLSAHAATEPTRVYLAGLEYHNTASPGSDSVSIVQFGNGFNQVRGLPVITVTVK